jgi:hypothetical protein
MTKKYAVLRENQLTFNETESWFKKDQLKHVEQSTNEGKTVQRFEKKYKTKLIWREETAKRNDNTEFKYWGYFVV